MEPVGEPGRRRVENSYAAEELGPYTDFEWGMLNGKLSAPRWVLGDEWGLLGHLTRGLAPHPGHMVACGLDAWPRASMRCPHRPHPLSAERWPNETRESSPFRRPVRIGDRQSGTYFSFCACMRNRWL
jgi:hypothetical protein